jgi:tetratricopeptide (TPR) repeat protein
LYTILKEKSDKSVDIHYTILEKENHGSVPHLSIYNGLKYIFSGFILPPEKNFEGLEAIDAHFASVSKKYGYWLETPELTINQLGYRYLQINDFENAIRIFKENVKRYPKSANVYDSLGEAYEKSGQMGLAETNYQKAYDLGLQSGHPNTEVFHAHLLRVQKKK